MEIVGVICPLTNAGGGKRMKYRGRSKINHFSSITHFCISNKCLFQRSITSLVESASHLYKYQRDMRLMNSSGINKEPGLQRGAVGAAGTLAEFKGKPAEQAESSGLDPAACSSPTALHLTLTSHHGGLFVCK